MTYFYISNNKRKKHELFILLCLGVVGQSRQNSSFSGGNPIESSWFFNSKSWNPQTATMVSAIQLWFILDWILEILRLVSAPCPCSSILYFWPKSTSCEIDTFLLQRHSVTQLFVEAKFTHFAQLYAIILKSIENFKFIGSFLLRLYVYPEFWNRKFEKSFFVFSESVFTLISNLSSVGQ